MNVPSIIQMLFLLNSSSMTSEEKTISLSFPSSSLSYSRKRCSSSPRFVVLYFSGIIMPDLLSGATSCPISECFRFLWIHCEIAFLVGASAVASILKFISLIILLGRKFDVSACSMALSNAETTSTLAGTGGWLWICLVTTCLSVWYRNDVETDPLHPLFSHRQFWVVIFEVFFR